MLEKHTASYFKGRLKTIQNYYAYLNLSMIILLLSDISYVSGEAEANPASGTLMASASVSVQLREEVDDEDRREAAVKYKVEKHSCPYFCKQFFFMPLLSVVFRSGKSSNLTLFNSNMSTIMSLSKFLQQQMSTLFAGCGPLLGLKWNL